ncbi:MAG: hypothetical protein GC182_09445 [Rhodopseudomonas sp.]|nr:hypothetical protein [Rhodopseudomonas sp.]
MLSKFANIIEFAGLILAFTDYFGLSRYMEDAVDKARLILGYAISKFGFFKPIRGIALFFLPAEIKSAFQATTAVASVAASPIAFALSFIILYGLAYVGEAAGLVATDPFDTVALLLFYIASIAHDLTDPLQIHIGFNATSAIGTALFMAITTIFGFVSLSISILVMIIILNLLHKLLRALDWPRQGTIATVGLVLAVTGFILSYFTEPACHCEKS